MYVLGIDQMEAAVVRRLMDLREQGVGALVSQLSKSDLLSDANIGHPVTRPMFGPFTITGLTRRGRGSGTSMSRRPKPFSHTSVLFRTISFPRLRVSQKRKSTS